MSHGNDALFFLCLVEHAHSQTNVCGSFVMQYVTAIGWDKTPGRRPFLACG